MTGSLVQAEKRGAFWFARLNRADKRNALSEPMIDELLALCDRIDADAEARALVLWGANGVFCAGADFDRFQALMDTPPPAGVDPMIIHNRIFGTLLERMAAVRVATIGVVQGAAMAGGMGLACVMDRVIATEDAAFALPEVGLGIAPAQIAPFIARRVGTARAQWHMLTAARFDARAALAEGYADRVVSAAELPDVVAGELALLARVEPLALRVTKGITVRNEATPRAATMDAAAQDFAELMRTGRAREGIAATRARQPPPWHIAVPALPEFT